MSKPQRAERDENQHDQSQSDSIRPTMTQTSTSSCLASPQITISTFLKRLRVSFLGAHAWCDVRTRMWVALTAPRERGLRVVPPDAAREDRSLSSSVSLFLPRFPAPLRICHTHAPPDSDPLLSKDVLRDLSTLGSEVWYGEEYCGRGTFHLSFSVRNLGGRGACSLSSLSFLPSFLSLSSSPDFQEYCSEVRFICLFWSGILGVGARASSLPSLPSAPSLPSFRSRALPTFTKFKKGKRHACIVRRAAQRVRVCARISLGPLPRVPVSAARVCRSYADPARILAAPMESDAYACGEGNGPAGWRGGRSDSVNCVRLYGILSEFTPALRLSSLRRSKEWRALARSPPPLSLPFHSFPSLPFYHLARGPHSTSSSILVNQALT
ncbi:hypothetical protein B0H13DRAFT_2313692 [Mycena leptocephala]|nr:hypothetical protein B0H13DRAFT_2313692 [Mycena leptocephala]